MSEAPTVFRHRVSPRHLLLAGLVVAEGVVLLGYLRVTGTIVQAPRYVVYPFLWINVGLWAVLVVEPDAGSRRHRFLATAIALGYYVLLMAIAGDVVLGTSASPYLFVQASTPGWGPVVNGALPGVTVHLIPFETIGYAGLAYLLYANVLEVSRGLLAGSLGIVSCVSCTMPLWGPILGAIGGPAAGLAAAITAGSYDVGTMIFLGTVLLLYLSVRESPARFSPPSLPK